MFQTTNQSSLGYSSLVSNNGRIKANGFAPLSSLQAKLSLSNTSESKHVQAIWQLMTLDDTWGHLTTIDDSSWQLMTSWVFWDNDKQFVRLPPIVSVGYRRIKGDALWLLTSCSTVISHRYGKPTGFARNIIYKWWVSGFHIIPYLCWFPRVRTS